MKSQKKEKNDRLARKLVAELDYLLKEGFLCLRNAKKPKIVLSRGVSI